MAITQPKTTTLITHSIFFSRLPIYLILLTFSVGIIILLKLGFWQLHRAQFKQSILNQYNQNTHSPDILTSLPTSLNANLPFQTIKLHGHFLNQQQILLDSQIYQHQVGYVIYTPFELEDKIVLVNRGWVKANDRQANIMIPPMKDEITITGYLVKPSQNKFTKFDQSMLHSHLRIAKIDAEKLKHYLNASIYPWVIHLNEDSPYRMGPIDVPPNFLNPARHRGYAWQWFALAFTLLCYSCYYLYKVWKKHEK